MSPNEQLERYHNLQVVDPRLGLSFTANIWMYVSGGGNSVTRAEYDTVMRAVKKKQNLTSVPDIFYISGESSIDSGEPFYIRGIARAFAGRGSPDDIRDAIRIAWYATGCKPYYDPKRYTEGFFGQDCNAFVGNCLGISPNVPIRTYGRGTGLSDEQVEAMEGLEKTPKDVYLALPFMPLSPVTRLTQIREGTVIITYKTGGARPFKHIALVQSFQTMVGTNSPKALIEIAEWGTGGHDIRVHQDSVSTKLMMDATCPGMPGQKLIGWSPKTDELRFFLDSSSITSEFGPRGWDICGKQGW